MKKLLIGLVIVVMCLVGVPQSKAITAIVGSQVACDTAITGCNLVLLNTLTLLCDGRAGNLNCPQFFAPDRSDATGQTFYGINNNGNPSKCVKSVNGGVTWAACTTNPFATSTSGVEFGVARNGALLAGANIAAGDTCVIKRSTDGGVSWTTVHTQATLYICGGGGASEQTSLIKCDATTDYCVVLSFDQSVFFNVIPLNSTDNGATWKAGTTIALGGGNGSPPVANWGVITNDTIGITVGTTNHITAHPILRSGNTWVQGAVMSNWAGGNASSGCAAIINNGVNQILCPPTNAVLTTTYYLRDTLGGIVNSHIPVGVGAQANGPTLIAVSPSSGVIYAVLLDQLTTSKYRILVSIDSFASSITLGLITPTNAFGTPNGEILYYMGKIYFTSGGRGGSAQFMRLS